MAGIKDYSTTAGNNTSVGGVSIAEGMLPSNINNAFRAVAADVREWYNDAQWVIYGDGDGAHTCTYVSGTSFKIVGANVTSIYEANRRIKAIGSSTGTIFGTISSSTFSSDTTVNVTWDSGSLQNESLVIYVAILSASNTSIPLGVITGSMLSSGLLVSNSAHASHTPDDLTVFTTSASDSRYFRQDSTETIASGDTWSNSDTKVATTAAVSARIIDLVDDVGGFVPIANETSFPNANPDVNNGAGTIVSITALSTGLTANGSGVITISNGTVGNSTVTLNGCGAGATFASGFGLLVETTTTLNTYTFVRLVPKATEVSTVAANATNISAAGANTTNINTVAGQITPTNNIATLAGISGLSALASAESSGHVTNVSNNLSGVNSFAERYRIASSAPTSSLDVGDLYFDTTANELKVYKSSGWASAGSSVNGTSARFQYTATSNQTTFSGTDSSGNTLSYDSPFIDCYLNGVKLVNGTDITVTSGNSVVLASGAAAGDILDLVAYGTFNVAAINAVNITSGTLGSARLPTVPTTKGGTGLTSIGSANQVLRVNSGANGLEFADIPGFGGVLGVSDGGTGLSSLGSAGQALVVNAGANALEFANASSAEVYGFNLSFSPSTIRYNVTVVGGNPSNHPYYNQGSTNKYAISGSTATADVTLELFEGNTYIFDQSDSSNSGHPLRFSTNANNSPSAPYTTGVTVVGTPGQAGAYTQIVVASGAPTLYYYCQNHGNMGWTANTEVPANNNLQVTTTNQGQDNITNTQYAAFDDVLFSASGFTFSLSNGSLIATI
tara:strand:- start:2739 stop:5105 length:2367 start_codon:yes stop_codon:yes gene_type:complete